METVKTVMTQPPTSLSMTVGLSMGLSFGCIALLVLHLQSKLSSSTALGLCSVLLILVSAASARFNADVFVLLSMATAIAAPVGAALMKGVHKS